MGLGCTKELAKTSFNSFWHSCPKNDHKINIRMFCEYQFRILRGLNLPLSSAEKKFGKKQKNRNLFSWRRDPQHSDNHHNDIEHNDTKNNDIEHPSTQYKDIQNNDTKHSVTRHNDVQNNDTKHINTQYNYIQNNCPQQTIK